MTIENPVAEHPFDTDTRVAATDTPGRFRAELSPRWQALGAVVNGGYSVALSLSALREVLAHPDPLVVSSFFVRPGHPGPVEIDTEVLNQGRRVSTGQARVTTGAGDIVCTTASFTDLGRGSDETAGFSTMPDLPAPEDCIDPLAGAPMAEATLTEQIECRYPVTPGWFAGQPTGKPHAEFWIRFTGGRPADTASLALLVDAAAPVVLELGVPGSATVELTTHIRRRPAPGWLACRATTGHVAHGYHEEDFELWDTGNRLVAQARQLAVIPEGRHKTARS